MSTIDDVTDHPLAPAAVTELEGRLRALARMRPYLDRETRRRILQLRDDWRAAWKLKGVEMPELVVVCVGRLGTTNIELWRRDLDLKNLRVKVVNFMRSHPSLVPGEVWTALKAAYPELRPGDLIGDIYRKLTGDTTATDAPEARALEQDLKKLH